MGRIGTSLRAQDHTSLKQKPKLEEDRKVYGRMKINHKTNTSNSNSMSNVESFLI